MRRLFTCRLHCGRPSTALAWALAALLSFPALSAAEEGGETVTAESIRDLIIRLNKEYNYIGEELKKLEESVREFPATILNISVVNRDPLLRIVSLEVLDNKRPLMSHIYTDRENEALHMGGRHQFYLDETSTGPHQLKVLLVWSTGGAGKRAAREGRSDTQVNITVKPGVEHFIEFNPVRAGGTVVIRHHKTTYSAL
ncbi:MAG TPA: hypothetical protein ENJ37_05880 [Deltaproteobacteria bacterium]|nr:hypothetical protein [Deltaproteobacteria bacterium]